MRLAFLVEWIRNRDPQWNEFVERLHQAGGLVQEFAARFQEQQTKTTDLAQEILQQMGRNPHEISAALLGRVIAPGEWWQYLKELAGEHPAAALFVARQVVGNQEILMPRYAMDSPLAKALGM